MITGRTIGANGRLGNQIFQVAFLLAQSKKRGVEVAWRKWEYAQYFQGDFTPSLTPLARTVVEPAFHYTPDFYDSLDWTKDIDFHGYFQSPKYWQGCEDWIRLHLSFKPDFVESVRAKNQRPLSRETIAIHIRRGDYVGNEAYAQLNPIYYLSALETHFPNWRGCNLVLFSDDMNYARLHFGCFDNVHLADGSDIEDLCLMSLCNNHIIANSSFSWWGAWLANSKKVVRPKEHFAGKLAYNDIRDLYPTDWIEHEAEKLDLTNVTFLVPVSYDHEDRVNNLKLSLSMLAASFDTNFIICEHNGERFKFAEQWGDYIQFESPYFHRTMMLNIMAEMSQTPFIVNFDADVMFPPAQILQAVHWLRNGIDVVYPYSGRFVRMPRGAWYKRVFDSLDIGVVAGHNLPALRPADKSSVGGCIFFNKESFWEGGGENENMVSFSPDDVERFYRFTTLGFSVARVSGNLWHMEHFCGSNSGVNHPMIQHNRNEWAKVSRMNKEQLKEYVESWEAVEA